MRPVIILRYVNGMLRYWLFQMEDIHLLRNTLLQWDCMAKLDLKKAYLTVPIAKHSWDLLCVSGGATEYGALHVYPLDCSLLLDVSPSYFGQ